MQSLNCSSGSFDACDDSNNPLFQPAEISRMTRNLRSKLAHASIKAQLSPEHRLTSNEMRRRTKTLEGTHASPRPADTPNHHHFRSNSRRSSISNLSPVSSMSPNNSLLASAAISSPQAPISRINSVNSITEIPFQSPMADQLMTSSSAYPVPSTLPTPRSYAPKSMVTPQSMNTSMTQSMKTPQRMAHPSMMTPPDTFAAHQKQQLELQELQKQFQREYQEKVQHHSQNSPPFYHRSDIFGEPMDTTGNHFSDQNDSTNEAGNSGHPLQLQQAFSIPKSIERPRADARAVAFDAFENREHRKRLKGPELRIDATSSEDFVPLEPATPPPIRRAMPKTPERRADPSTNDGASLLLHFAQSPGRGTPRTPDFNMSDYLQFQTPSPARNQLTPHHGRWGSLNSTLFSSTSSSLAPPAMPDLGRVTNTASYISNQ